MTTSRYQGIGRRQFLSASACALAALAVGPKLLAGAAPPRKITVGFAPLETGAVDSAGFTQNLVSAETVSAPDLRFLSRGAKVAIQGRSGDPRSGRALEFAAHFAAESHPEKTFPFHVWSGSGSPVRFTVPVESQRRLLFTIATPSSSDGSTHLKTGSGPDPSNGTVTLPVELSLAGGAINLVRGYYVIVPLYDGDSAPNWWAYSLNGSRGRWALRGVDGSLAQFEHFIVRIDYAKEENA